MYLVTRQGQVVGLFSNKVKLWQAVEAIVGSDVSDNAEAASAKVFPGISLGTNHSGRDVPLSLANLTQALQGQCIGVLPVVSDQAPSRLRESSLHGAADLQSCFSGKAGFTFKEKRRGIDNGKAVIVVVYDIKADTLLDYRVSANTVTVALTVSAYDEIDSDTAIRKEELAQLMPKPVLPVTPTMSDLEFAATHPGKPGKKRRQLRRPQDDDDSDSTTIAPEPQAEQPPAPVQPPPQPAQPVQDSVVSENAVSIDDVMAQGMAALTGKKRVKPKHKA